MLFFIFTISLNEGEEKNNSPTQAKWGRREKNSLTTQENLVPISEE